VQYVGDESTALSFPHGNSKKTSTTRSYERTAPSVLANLANELKEHKPSIVHKKSLTSTENINAIP
jgi:hypothetical protein